MNGKKLLLIWLLISIALIGAPENAAAQESNPTDDDVNRIARQLYCPVCENIPLDTCGTAACEQWRGVIRDKLAAGWSDERIKTYFVEQYGDRVLAEPPRRGFNWLAYVVPPLAFAAGLVMLFLGYQRWKTSGDPDVIVGEPESDLPGEEPPQEYLDRVEKELNQRESR